MTDLSVPGPDRPGVSGTTFTGVVYWPLDPRPEEINILDIAHSLAMQCRFNGHIKRFLSVAEHSYWVSQVVPQELALEGLLHDAAEAYLGDIIRPLKVLPDFRHYKMLEMRWEREIARLFGLEFPLPAAIKVADEAVVAAEIAQLREPSKATLLHDPAKTADIRLEGWAPQIAETVFLERFNLLMDKREAA